MSNNNSRELRTRITGDARLEISIKTVARPVPNDDEVLIKVEATPINPSDLSELIEPGDITTIAITGTGDDTVVTMDVPEAMMPAMQARLNDSLPIGNEGAGTVVAAGKNAKALIGKVVGVAGGAMYSEYRCVDASACLVMNEGTTPAQGASCFVNPLTALGMVETMKMENHTALVHTAAASNLGQMLVKICLADDVQLVNIVRRQEQVELLMSIGAKHICNTADADFKQQLIDALIATGATLAFDATGGGLLASDLLSAMEIAANKTTKQYSRYGSDTYKQVYLYGDLDISATTLNRAFGMSWGIGGWLLPHFIQKAGMETFGRLRQRVADEIDTTFASTYTREVSLAETLSAEAITEYAKQATGTKFLITPHK